MDALSIRGCSSPTAIAFTRQGAKVGVNYHGDEGGAQAALAQIEAAGGREWLKRVDIGHPAEVGQMVEKVESDVGPLRVLAITPPPGSPGEG